MSSPAIYEHLLLLAVAAVVVFPNQLPYPPLDTTPSAVSSPAVNVLVMALPTERAVVVYEIDSGSLWRIGLGFVPEGVVSSGDRALAYSRIQQKAALLDLRARAVLREIDVRVEAAWPAANGFLVHDGLKLIVLSPDGEIVRDFKTGYAGSPWSGSAKGNAFWFVGEDLVTLNLLDLSTGQIRQVYKHNDKITAVLALTENSAAISSKGYMGIIRSDGTRRDLKIPYQVSEATFLFPAKAGRVVFVDLIHRVVGIIGEDLAEHRVVERLTFALASPAPSKLYVLDPSAKTLDLFDLTFEPEIREARFLVTGKSTIRVEAVVVDLDKDAEPGFPQVVVEDSKGTRTIVPMRALPDSRYSADVDLRDLRGTATVRVVVRDEEGHVAQSKEYRVEVEAGEIKTTTGLTVTNTVTSPAQTGRETQQLLLSSVELTFFLVLVGALVLVALRARRTGRSRARKRKA